MSSFPRAPRSRPRILIGIDGSPRGATARRALLKAVASFADADVCVADQREHEEFGLALRHAAQRRPYAAVIVWDGPVTRRALRGLIGVGSPVVLATDAEACAAVDSHKASPGPDLAGLPFPREIWMLGKKAPRPAPVEFLPERCLTREALDSAWLRRRLAALAGPPAPVRGELTTIIIPCWNGIAYIRDCLASVLAHTNVPFEVVVVDNGSTDGTAAYVRSLRDSRLRLICNRENLGFARAINQGLEKARGHYALWLNSDCVVGPGWLPRMLAALERAPWVGAVGPYTNRTSGQQRVNDSGLSDVKQLPYFAEAWALSRAGRAAWIHRLTGFCFLHRMELVREIGHLDEQFGLGSYEDLDFCLRAKLAGYHLFIAEDVFVHHHGHGSFELNGLSFGAQTSRNRELFLDKWCRRALSFLDGIDVDLFYPETKVRSRKRGAFP